MILHHGDHVRIGTFDGPAGIVLQCRKRDGSGSYFKVKLVTTEEWVWPDRVVVDSIGTYETTCQECDGRFRSDSLAEVLCPNCDRRDSYHDAESFGAHRRALRGNVRTKREVSDDDSPF